MDIKKVLVADAVDSACVDILKQHGILVDCKYKLQKAELIEIIKVRIFSLSDYFLNSVYYMRYLGLYL